MGLNYGVGGGIYTIYLLVHIFNWCKELCSSNFRIRNSSFYLPQSRVPESQDSQLIDRPILSHSYLFTIADPGRASPWPYFVCLVSFPGPKYAEFLYVCPYCPLDSKFNKMRSLAFPVHLCPQRWNITDSKYLDNRRNGWMMETFYYSITTSPVSLSQCHLTHL